MKPIQYFSDNSLKTCKKMTTSQILRFLEDFRKLQETPAPSILISLKIPQSLLEEFKEKSRRSNVKYQTQIKNLMRSWLRD